MSRRIDLSLKAQARALNKTARHARKTVTMGKRARIGSAVLRGPYLPPENWYEPKEDRRDSYKVVQQGAGDGFRHVVTAEEIRHRLAMLPAWMVKPLEVVQLSRMTRKKLRSPCYGMQWGSTIYLYPIEEALVETFCDPPLPAQKIEAAMFGARWQPAPNGLWTLHWTASAVRDFYLNNVLIHELGHILDNRNTNSRDRERFAEWFALELGYKASSREDLSRRTVNRYVTKRHGVAARKLCD
jgi:hypothetical protein